MKATSTNGVAEGDITLTLCGLMVLVVLHVFGLNVALVPSSWSEILEV